MFSFGFIEELTGSMRNSADVMRLFYHRIVIIVFFAIDTEKKVQEKFGI
jgi:UMF1 family MFS transporter